MSHRVSTILGHLSPNSFSEELEMNPTASSSSSSSSKGFQDDDIVIVSAVRTPQGSFNGVLSSFTAPQLGSIAIKASLERINLAGTAVDEVIFGNVLQANVGQAPARQAAIGAGLPESTPCTTVNKVCASGMKAISMAAQGIIAGDIDIAVVGGMESMSNAPYYLSKERFGAKFGHSEALDGLIKDGLFDPYNQSLMGDCAEICSETFNVTREQQDDYAHLSYTRAAEATKAGAFKEEIVPITIKGKRGKPDIVIDSDEEFTRYNAQKARKMRPVFKKNGTVTVVNASPLSDGASAMVVTSGRVAKRRGLKPLAVIESWADAAREPKFFTVAPALAVPKAIKRASLSIKDIDLFELNEAFAVVAVANCNLLGISSDIVNVNGGGVALGHPLGCSGSRIIVTLINALKQNGKSVGCAGICNGGGGASAMVIRVVE